MPNISARVPNWLKCVPFIGLHVACLAALFTGFDATALVLLVATYFLKMFGITAGYHRYFAHRAYKTSRVGAVRPGVAGVQRLAERAALVGGASPRPPPLFRHAEGPAFAARNELLVGAPRLGHDGGTPTRRRGRRSRTSAASPNCAGWIEWHWVPGIVLAVACYLIGAVVGGWRGDLSTFFLQGQGWTRLVWGWLISTVLTLPRDVLDQLAEPPVGQAPLRHRRRQPQQRVPGAHHARRRLAQQPPPLPEFRQSGLLLVGNRHQLHDASGAASSWAWSGTCASRAPRRWPTATWMRPASRRKSPRRKPADGLPTGYFPGESETCDRSRTLG